MSDRFNQVVWVDIPVLDLDRAMNFYRSVLGQPVTEQTYGSFRFALLPNETGTGGCLIPMEGEPPGTSGPLVYLNVAGRMNAALEAVAPGGGTVVKARHEIGPHGFRAVILDSEGNRLALHAPPGEP